MQLMNTSLNEAVKTFKGSSSNLSICFDIENRGDYKEQIGLYQKIKDFCNENNLNISFWTLTLNESGCSKIFDNF